MKTATKASLKVDSNYSSIKNAHAVPLSAASSQNSLIKIYKTKAEDGMTMIIVLFMLLLLGLLLRMKVLDDAPIINL